MARKGQSNSPETRARISAAKMGHKVTPETRTKISESLKGKSLSPEHRGKIGDANRGPRCDHYAPIGATYMDRGYVKVKVAEPNVWDREHRVVMGLSRGDKRVVHHLDGNKRNNDLVNLRVFQSRSEHTRYHQKG